MIIERELRSEILSAIRGEVSLSELYAWLMARSWNMHRDSSPAAVELAAAVEALFFEQSESDDAAILRALAALAAQESFVKPLSEWQANNPIVKIVWRLGPDPEWPIVTSAAQRPRWLHPATVEV